MASSDHPASLDRRWLQSLSPNPVAVPPTSCVLRPVGADGLAARLPHPLHLPPLPAILAYLRSTSADSSPALRPPPGCPLFQTRPPRWLPRVFCFVHPETVSIDRISLESPFAFPHVLSGTAARLSGPLSNLDPSLAGPPFRCFPSLHYPTRSDLSSTFSPS